MENGIRALIIGAGVLITVAVITIAVLIFQSGQDAAKQAQSNFTDIQKQLSQQVYVVYDQTTVSGSEAVNAIRKFVDKEQFGIEVKTGKMPNGVWYGNQINEKTGQVGSKGTGQVSEAIDEASDQYINPSGKFHAVVIYDSNRVVRGIVFTQQ